MFRSRTYLQGNIPNPGKIFSFSLSQFTGGLNNRDQLPEETQAMSLMNMAFTPDGLMEKRRGTTWFDSLALDKPIIFLDEYKPHKETNILVRATENKVYMGSALLRENKGRMDGMTHEGKYFFADTSGLFVYGRFDQTESTYVKIIGTKTENYVLMEVVSPPEGFTPLGVEHTEGVRKVDYTNRKVWYEPCKNEIEDTFKGANVVPKDPRFMAQREGRMYVAGSDDNDDTVYITDSGNPYYFPAVLSMQLPPNSDRISGIAVFNDCLIVGRRFDIHAITGDTNRTDAGLPVFKLHKLSTHTGVASHQAMVNAHNYLFYLGTDSQFYALRVTEAGNDVLATQQISKDIDIHGKPINIKKEDIWYASGVFYQNCYYVAIGDKILVYHYDHRGWTVYDQIGARCFYDLLNVLIMGDGNGRIVMPSDDFLDNGKPYKAYWTSKNFDMDEPTTFKMFRDFFVVTRSVADYVSRVRVLFEVDYQNTADFHDVSTRFSIYGESKWGDVYVNREINASNPFMVFQRGRMIRITVSNGEYIAATVKTFEDLSTIPGIHDGMIAKVEGDEKLYIHENAEWREADMAEYNQGMCVIQLNGEYEYKWKR